VGAKLYADTANKVLVITQAPDGDGFIDINVQVDVWSDLIEDWESDVVLRGHTFPIVLVGAQTISAGKLGSTYVLLDPWQIEPYEADHDLNINGNLFTESALTKLVLPTVGDYTVTVNRNLSTLVEVVETGTSGLTPTESQALIDIDANVDALIVDVAALEAKIDLLLSAQDLTNEQKEAEHWTEISLAPETTPGKLVLRNTSVLRRWEADAYETEPGTTPMIGYRGTGLEYIGQLAEVAYS